jgi:hypothetical protein
MAKVLTAVETDDRGEEIRLSLTLPDAYEGALATNDAESRLRLLLQREVTRAKEVSVVARRDAESLRLPPVAASELPGGREAGTSPRRTIRQPDAGPNQIAFAGSKEPAVPEGEARKGNGGEPVKADAPKVKAGRAN